MPSSAAICWRLTWVTPCARNSSRATSWIRCLVSVRAIDVTYLPDSKPLASDLTVGQEDLMNVLISGASVAGPVTAYWLQRHGHRVTVVEKAPSPRRTGGHAVDLF